MNLSQKTIKGRLATTMQQSHIFATDAMCRHVEINGPLCPIYEGLSQRFDVFNTELLDDISWKH